MTLTSLKSADSFFERNFLSTLTGITLLSFIIRAFNCTYASMWSDELYSMLSVHPDNSLYDILLLQRRDQPPLYFVILKLWVTVFGYNDLSARMLSVITGSAAVFVIGWVNRKIFNVQVGLITAFLVAFNITQIYFSIEARFYVMVFLLVACSFYTYWLTTKEKSSWFIHIIHGGFCAAIILTHHFGAFVVLVYGLFDLYDLVTVKFKWSMFRLKAAGYLLTLFITGLWFYWSLTAIQTVHDYWLKVIDAKAYLLYNLNYYIISLIVLLGLAFYGLIRSAAFKERFSRILLAQIVLVTAVPLVFSYVKFPILVDRYSFAMAPAIYTLIAIGLVAALERIKNYRVIAGTILCFLLIADGVYYSFINRSTLLKEPWREMAAWIKKESGFPNIPIYTTGIIVNNRFTIDYYLPEKRVVNILWDSSQIRNLDRFYLIETNSHDRLPKDFKQNLDSLFQKREVFIGLPEYGKGGIITIYENPETATVK